MILLSKSPGLAPDPEFWIGYTFFLGIVFLFIRFIITCLILAGIAVLFKFIIKKEIGWKWFILFGFIGFVIGLLLQFTLIGDPDFIKLIHLPEILSAFFVLVYLILRKRKKID